MSDETSESYAWKMFKEAAIFVSFLLGFAWVFAGSTLLLTTVLRAILR